MRFIFFEIISLKFNFCPFHRQKPLTSTHNVFCKKLQIEALYSNNADKRFLLCLGFNKITVTIG